MSIAELLDALGSESAGQWGLVTSRQAARLGVTVQELARNADRGILRRVRHGVYAMPGAPGDHLEDIRAEWLVTDIERTVAERQTDADPVVVSHESAALVHGLGDFAVGVVHLTASRRIRPAANTPVKSYRGALHPREIVWIDGLPVTSVRRTLEDLSTRWELGHLRDAARDALHKDLLPGNVFAKSARLVELMPDLAPPVTHAGLKQRLKNTATISQAVQYDQFFRLHFLSLLGGQSQWVLKGGSHLLFRLTDARATRDLDLFASGANDATDAARELRSIADGGRVGRYTFRIGDIKPGGQGGHRDIARVHVDVLNGRTHVATFNIDVSGSVELAAPPTRSTISVAPVPIPGYANTVSVPLYPIENQLADKLAALYQDYGQGVSTRYHDLYDAAMIVDQLTFDDNTFREALSVQCERRGVLLDPTLPEPGPGWSASYDREVPKLDGTKPPFNHYDAAMSAVRERICPLLATRGTSREARPDSTQPAP